jgi:AcrR family transcriptional regulator
MVSAKQGVGAPPARAARGRPALDDEAIARLRAEIVDAAARAFADRGVRAATIDDIAREAGVSRASVYRYGGSRDELVLHVTLRRFEEWVDGVVEHARRAGTAADVVAEAIIWTARTVERDPSLASLFEGGTAREASDVLTARPRRGATNAWRERYGALLEQHAGELRHGLTADEVADHVLGVILDLLSHRHRREVEELRAWITTWVLPAVLEARPALPDRQPNPSTSSTQTSVA